ncbi:MAG: hypothetical protein KME06_09095 [Kastovskya adunca ATA6-11-RM4]|nr:hypothetical protein [Kastovskya adunca ATA6-11-RM4]
MSPCWCFCWGLFFFSINPLVRLNIWLHHIGVVHLESTARAINKKSDPSLVVTLLGAVSSNAIA